MASYVASMTGCSRASALGFAHLGGYVERDSKPPHLDRAFVPVCSRCSDGSCVWLCMWLCICAMLGMQQYYKYGGVLPAAPTPTGGSTVAADTSNAVPGRKEEEHEIDAEEVGAHHAASVSAALLTTPAACAWVCEWN